MMVRKAIDLNLNGLMLEDMPEQMTKEDYATIFARVITPKTYAMVLGACAAKALAGNMKAIELIMTQAQGTPTPRLTEQSPETDALRRIQEVLFLAGQKVEYSVVPQDQDT